MPIRHQPADIQTFASRLDTLGDQATTAKAYAQQWVAVDSSQAGLFSEIVHASTNACDKITDACQQLNQLLSGSGASLTAIAQFYKTAEQNRIDRFEQLCAEIEE
ncbi:MAG: hypothetical protein LBM66_02600 [Bifidobacteriaceae bacterium]|jgi:hypothetical protein|nr:hypothetical protein [Bifidobacteriaceae bacterium]